MHCTLVASMLLSTLLSAEPAVLAPVEGAAISTLRGPTDFSKGQPAPELQVQRISIRAELRPALAIVEQTVTVNNPGTPTKTTVGIAQGPHDGRDGARLVPTTPLAVSVWHSGARLTDDDVTIRRSDNAGAGGEPGYEVAIRVAFPSGESELSVILALPTVPEVRVENIRRPASSGPAHFGLQVSHFPWDWSDEGEPDTALPKTTTVVSTAGGLPLDSLAADVWAHGAVGDGSAWFWTGTPRLTLRYEADPDAPRPETHDALIRAARSLVAEAPVGHLNVPSGAEAVPRPGTIRRPGPLDPARARRALIVPMSLATLLLIAGWLYVRRRLS
ncbi:MAG: hypothetical protein ACI9WU_005452 [Myxococcota bacterium]|jgi:hypothetical protein